MVDVAFNALPVVVVVVVCVGRLFPMWLGMGFGLGKTYGEAGRLLTMAHDELLRSLEDSREEQQQQKTQN